MTYKELKDFCNSLTEEQLTQEVYVARVDDSPVKVESHEITDVDRYFDHTDLIGTLEEIKADNPDDWQDIIEDATLVPAGTVMLVDE